MTTRKVFKATAAFAALTAAATFAGAANAQPFFDVPQAPAAQQPVYEQPADDGEFADPALRRQLVNYPTREAPGTIIVDTPSTYLYFVLGHGKAIRYGIGVGREGFTWSGVKTIGRKAEWPDWRPPAEMIARQPYLPRVTAGGPGNPLGARALYIAGTAYRIHGTNDPSTIGHRVSSGCIRLTNDDIVDLYGRVQIGANVIVLPQRDDVVRVADERGPAVETVTAYAPASRAMQTWSAIKPGSLY